MSAQERKAWESFLKESLKEREESAGVIGIRADLCRQILDMSKNELFEFCQELESIPGLLDKPEPAMDCETCKKEFGMCTGRLGDVDLKDCEKRFWSYVEKKTEKKVLEFVS